MVFLIQSMYATEQSMLSLGCLSFILSTVLDADTLIGVDEVDKEQAARLR